MRDCTKPENYHDLVESARHCAGDGNCQACEYDTTLNCIRHLISDAAAAIEALLKENKELIEDRPEMVEADGHWEWRKPNGEVLLPKRGKWYEELFDGDKKYQCSNCLTHWDVETRYCPFCGAKMEVQE